MNEITLIVGYNSAGKTTLAQKFVDVGCKRFNRDESGGKVIDLVSEVRQTIQKGHEVVLDNTFPTIESRAPFVDLAKEMNVSIRCAWLKTSFEDAQLNACLRMVRKCGRLLTPAEMKTTKDPNLFPPAAIFSYKKKFEKPTKTEGFIEVAEVPFVRTWGLEYINSAVILDYDDTLRTSTGPNKWPTDPSHIEILPNRTEVLRAYKNNGHLLLGVSNQSAISKGLSKEVAEACFKRTNELLGLEIDYEYCPHNVPPVVCFCRKPHPGLGAHFIERYKLFPSLCIMVGDQTTDATFAKRCGFQYKDAKEFFKE